MSKSMKRVVAALQAAGLQADIHHMANETRTAADAAREAGCDIDQIAKSIIFRGEVTGKIVLFITAGGNHVDPDKASEVAGEPLGRADAAAVRSTTGFAIGGVSPVGHLTPPRSFFDPTLLRFDQIYAAAGTPHHIFSISSQDLLKISSSQIADFV
jgi:prolyl-tRNA editing enzyme YbaK/EbsC (Cys-tRNA(Pro) deacylase)